MEKKTIEFDEKAERKRLKGGHKGAGLKRQLAILDAFVSLDIAKAIELYSALPYDDEEGCPEQEYVGMYLDTVLNELHACRDAKLVAHRLGWSDACVVSAKITSSTQSRKKGTKS